MYVTRNPSRCGQVLTPSAKFRNKMKRIDFIFCFFYICGVFITVNDAKINPPQQRVNPQYTVKNVNDECKYHLFILRTGYIREKS